MTKTITYDETKWQLVPKEPTPGMVDAPEVRIVAPCHGCGDTLVNWAQCEEVYRSMLTAAPEPLESESCSVLIDRYLGRAVDHESIAQEFREKAEQLQIEQLRKELAAKQAEIDRLMLEFCPDEMTDEQKAEWARNQKQEQSEETK